MYSETCHKSITFPFHVHNGNSWFNWTTNWRMREKSHAIASAAFPAPDFIRGCGKQFSILRPRDCGMIPMLCVEVRPSIN